MKKKIFTLMLGLSMVMGAMAFADDARATTKKIKVTKTKKTKKAKAAPTT